MRRGFKIKCENIIEAPKMDLKKVNNKYIIASEPNYCKLLKAQESYLEAPLTKCGKEIIDKIEIFPYKNNIDITKVSIKIFYFDVSTEEKFRVELHYIIENKGWLSREKKKYWEIKVYKINKSNDLGTLTDIHSEGTSLSDEIKKIFGEDKINESKIIEFLLKFNYTKYSKYRNLKIGGSVNV